jgi:CubicO group peptidase (beta-lactamase class C family)
MSHLLPLLLLAFAEPPATETDAIVRILAEQQKASDVPGMIAGIIRGDRLVAVGAVGVRKAGDPTPMTSADVEHLGSNTKSMTATMIATLIEEGKLSWDTTLEKVFPAEAKEWHEDWRGVTLHQLLTHTASLPANLNFHKLGSGTTTELRRNILTRDWFKRAPEHKPGSHFLYSNIGYVLAGLMAETVTGKSWEDLMHERLFGPLGMTRTGFGTPGTSGKVDQPWGHVLRDGKAVASQEDNAPPIGPAGTVHAPLADWAKYVIQHLQSEQPATKTKLLLKPETFRKLHTPVLNDYACGWVRLPIPGKKTRYLFHNGSNTFWYAEMWLDPEANVAVLVATNEGGDAARRAVLSAAKDLIVLARKK